MERTSLDFIWLPKQKELVEVNHNNDRDFCCFYGAFGCGKTQGVVQLAIMLGFLYANSRILIGAQSNSLLQDTTYKKFQSLLPPESLPMNDRHRERWSGCPDDIRIFNGTEFIFRHLSDPERLKSSEFDTIVIEEMSQIPKATWDMLVGRLRWNGSIPTSSKIRQKKRKRIFGGTNPEESPGWIYDLFFENKTDSENYRVVRTKTEENTILLEEDPNYINSMLEAYDPDIAEIFIYGNPGNMRGKRPYRRFSRGKNTLKEARKYIQDQPLCLCCDFNIDPCGWVVVQEQDIGVVVLQEITKRKTDTWEMCEEFKKKYPVALVKGGLHIYGDASGSSKTANSKSSNWKIVQEELADYMPSFHVPRGNPLIKDRINAVNAMLENALGEVRLFLNPVSMTKELTLDFERCSWDKTGEKIDQAYDKSTGSPMRSHWADCIGYFINKKFPIVRKGQVSCTDF